VQDPHPVAGTWESLLTIFYNTISLSVGPEAAVSTMETKSHLSRHFLGTQPTVLRSIPFASPGQPDDDGATMKHRLLALGDWNEDAQVSHS
jgi:hypothetical protein